MDAKDIGKKVENPVLLEAMKKLRENENSETLRAFLGAVVHAVFVVPATFDKDPVVTADGKQTLEQGVKINFALLTNGNGEKVLPCFTDEDTFAASQFNEGFKRIIFAYKQVEDLVLNSKGGIGGIAMNPFTENCFVSGDFIRQYREHQDTGIVENKIKPGTKVNLRKPKYQPINMLEEATKYLEEKGNVNRAYIQMMEEAGKEDKYLITLDMAEGEDEKPVIAGLIPLLKPHSFGIEIAFVTSKGSLGSQTIRMTDPFYTREGYAATEKTAENVSEDTEEENSDSEE